jgi:hypothetical protein
MGSEYKQINRKLGHRFSIRINTKPKSQVGTKAQEQVNLNNTVTNTAKEPKKKQDIRNQECQQNFLNPIHVLEINKSQYLAIWIII